MAEFRKLPAARYAPPLLLAGLAVVMAVLTWHSEPPAKADPEPSTTAVPSGLMFKSPYRQQREEQAARARKPAEPKANDLEPITVEEATQMVAESRNYERPSTRGRIAREAIRRLCAAGHAEAAFSLIEKEPSEARKAGITAFFETAKSDETTLMAHIKAFGNTADATAALDAYLQRVAIADLDDFISGNRDMHPLLPQALASYLNRNLETGTQRAHTLAIIDGLHSQGLVSDDIVLRKLVEDQTTDPFDRMKEMGTRISKDTPRYQEAIWAVLHQMTEKDAPRAAQYALAAGQRTKSGSNPVLRTVLMDWAHKDAAAAGEWCHDKLSGLSSDQQDDVVWVLAVGANQGGKKDEAEKWLAKVSDPKTKKQLSQVLTYPPPQMYNR